MFLCYGSDILDLYKVQTWYEMTLYRYINCVWVCVSAAAVSHIQPTFLYGMWPVLAPGVYLPKPVIDSAPSRRKKCKIQLFLGSFLDCPQRHFVPSIPHPTPTSKKEQKQEQEQEKGTNLVPPPQWLYIIFFLSLFSQLLMVLLLMLLLML